MIKKICTLTLVLAGLAFTLGHAGAPSPAKENASGNTNMIPLVADHFRGRHYLWSVVTSNFIRGPLWEQNKADPPLSPRRALEIAERQAFLLVPDSVRFNPQEIVLKRFVGVWFYVVQLEPSNPRAPAFGGPMEPIKIVVLMDGTVADRFEQ